MPKPKYTFNQADSIKKLNAFFTSEKSTLNSFGNLVNQTFEAYTFASTIQWYKNNGWEVEIVNPIIKKIPTFRLKFSTRGNPNNYSYAICSMVNNSCQIRHQLRVSTKSNNARDNDANICCDIVILKDIDLQFYNTETAVPNESVISFGEVKHMSAFAELIAGFIGMVHEIQPSRLKRIRLKSWVKIAHLSPYLNVSGYLFKTAKGIKKTIEKRKYDIDIYDYENKMNEI